MRGCVRFEDAENHISVPSLDRFGIDGNMADEKGHDKCPAALREMAFNDSGSCGYRYVCSSCLFRFHGCHDDHLNNDEGYVFGWFAFVGIRGML